MRAWHSLTQLADVTASKKGSSENKKVKRTFRKRFIGTPHRTNEDDVEMPKREGDFLTNEYFPQYILLVEGFVLCNRISHICSEHSLPLALSSQHVDS